MQRQESTIGIRVTESGDDLLASDLLVSWTSLLHLLAEIDLALSGQSTPTLDWSVRQLSRSSPTMLVLEPMVKGEQLDSPDSVDNRDAVIRIAMAGIAELQERDGRPSHFSDQALNDAVKLVSILGPRIQSVEVFTPEDTIVCSEAVATNVRGILHAGYEMLGSTEGVLEAMNSHRRFQFAVYEPVRAVRIQCELDRNAEQGLKDRIVNLYEQRVRVSGILRTNRQGEVRSARVQQVTSLRTEAKFSNAEEIAGIYDITGGLDAEEYVRRLRDA